MDIGLDLGRLAIETKSNLDDQEWLNKWKEFYKPFCVGNRIFVKPVWEDMEAPDGRVTFKINLATFLVQVFIRLHSFVCYSLKSTLMKIQL